MKKVYVLNSVVTDDQHVLGVFSSKKKAEEAVCWLKENDTFYKHNPEDLEIDVYELNGEIIE